MTNIPLKLTDADVQKLHAFATAEDGYAPTDPIDQIIRQIVEERLAAHRRARLTDIAGRMFPNGIDPALREDDAQ